MTQLGLTFFIILSYEILLYFKFLKLLKFNLFVYKKLYLTFFSKLISDNKKEFLIISISKKLFFISTKIVFIILFILFIFILIDSYIIDLVEFTISFFGLFLSIFVLFIYNFLRRKICKTIM
tara:strand:+ start:1904 stop:2269 length:366 start_codon:yes stop_codon:yes gene_type:complete